MKPCEICTPSQQQVKIRLYEMHKESKDQLMTLSTKCVFMFAQAAELPQQETWSDAKLTLEQHSNLIESMGLKGKVITPSA